MDKIELTLVLVIGFCELALSVLNSLLIRRNRKLAQKLEAANQTLDGNARIIASLANEVHQLRGAAWDNECQSADDIRQQIADAESDMNDGEGWKHGA